ncbi:hypothetical protein [Teredinibacter sp. KSP-S5-2]|uniref:hypothetical protein n=1 Tax=Teredinibacter sp. KSP-S5-2 TaxID=3034506 RepID=UPI002934AF37|nr:hypothetical protein [Teredinibacter sp. KSP-S5-2]WNO07883.1 hypothetical protein P5V12_12940 [Teredinibacter sp. KSP-S5-2]
MSPVKTLLYSFFVVSVIAGCTVSDRAEFTDSEAEISDDFFDRIQENVTTKHWIVSQLGEPFRVIEGDDNQEIYTYEFTKAYYRRATLLILLRYSGVSRDESYFHVLFQKNVVKKHWHSKEPVADVGRFLVSSNEDTVEGEVSSEPASKPDNKSAGPSSTEGEGSKDLPPPVDEAKPQSQPTSTPMI